jgi:hypothetical protein
VINQRQFVAEGFEALPPADRLLVAQRVQIAGLQQADHRCQGLFSVVEGLIQG